MGRRDWLLKKKNMLTRLLHLDPETTESQFPNLSAFAHLPTPTMKLLLLLLLLLVVIVMHLSPITALPPSRRLRARGTSSSSLPASEIVRVDLETDDPARKEKTSSPTTASSSPNYALASYQGSQLLVNVLTSSKSSKVLNLLQSLETQMNMGACALASAVTVLNAMGHRQPYDPTYTYATTSYPYWTQTSYAFDECVKKHVGPSLYQGETLEQLSASLGCLGLKTSTRFAEGTTSQQATNEILAHLEANHYVIVNFDRKLLHEEGGGHFSPLAAGAEGRVLILDVARYKYTPVWVPHEDLFNAMASSDGTSGKSRGFVAVWK